MHDFNKSLVMKLGWGLVANPNALWARVIRDKYGCGSRKLPSIQTRGAESHVWRAIQKSWPDLQCNLSWRIGDGTVAKFWTDRWLLSGSILCEVGLGTIPAIDVLQNVKEYYDQNTSSWILARFGHLLPQHVVSEILNMPPPAPNIGEDFIIWSLTSDGMFSSKSAYDSFSV